MAKKTIFVVKNGLKTGLFENTSWDEVKHLVVGFPNAEYKGFSDLVEAKVYFLGNESKGTKKPSNKGANKGTWDEETFDYKGFIAFTDGSNKGDGSEYSFGLVFLEDGKVIHEDARKYSDKYIAQRNVAGELKGVIAAMTYAKALGVDKLRICYDYTGILLWTDGTWRAKQELSIKYAQTVSHFKQYMSIEFIKVPAHSNVKHNERADILAKQVLGIK